jgi:hypothetical protein
MERRMITHLAPVAKNIPSVRTTIPLNIIKQLKLQPTDMIEWLITAKGDVVVKKL